MTIWPEDNFDPELIHDYVHDEDGFEYEDDLFGENE